MNLKSFLVPAVAAVTFLASPATSLADRKVTVYRDRDHDGHYNKKTYEAPNHGHRYYGGRGYYGGPSYYGYRPYYRPSYNYGYGHRPYYDSYDYPRTTLGISLFSRPSYNYSYRDYQPGHGSLAVDVQSALRKRGYYRGPIDGDIGDGSRSAIRAYQRDHGLSATGRIDSSLLRSLHID